MNSSTHLNKSQEENFNTRTIQSLWQAVFWISFPFGVVTFLLPIYGKELGASAIEIGGFFTAFSIVPAIIRPFLGRALDRWGRRPFLLLGLAGYLLATVVFAWSDTVILLTIARFLQGIGSAFLWIATYTMIADLARVSGRGQEFGSLDEASYRGGLIGTTLGIGLVIALEETTNLDFQTIWLILFGLYLIPTLFALITGWRGAAETLPPAVDELPEKLKISKQLLALMIIVMVTGASQMMVWPLLMVFLQDHLGAGILALTAAYLPAALISSFLPSRMGKIADRLGRKGPMIVGLLIGAGASVVIPFLMSVVTLALLWTVETFGYTVSIPAERAFVADIAGKDVRGTSYGLYTFSYFLGSALGPLAGGWLYDHVSQATPFYLNSFVLVIGAILVGLVLKEPEISPGSKTELKF
jgi:DHA1 family multidrug resistance protein-like MFS transporter